MANEYKRDTVRDPRVRMLVAEAREAREYREYCEISLDVQKSRQ